MDDKKYFTRVINENEGIIYKVSSLYTNSREDRDDLYQEIIYQLWKSFPTFKEQSKISTWLYRVALNTAIYQLKKSKRSISAGFIDKEALSFIEEDHQPEEEQLKLFYAHIDHLGLMEKGSSCYTWRARNATPQRWYAVNSCCLANNKKPSPSQSGRAFYFIYLLVCGKLGFYVCP